MADNGAHIMMDHPYGPGTDLDHDDVETKQIAVDINGELKDEFKSRVNAKHGGRTRGVFRHELETAISFWVCLYDMGLEPVQAIERLNIYEKLVPIEGELHKLNEKYDQQQERLNEKYDRQKTQLDRIDHELSRVLYSDISSTEANAPDVSDGDAEANPNDAN